VAISGINITTAYRSIFCFFDTIKNTLNFNKIHHSETVIFGSSSSSRQVLRSFWSNFLDNILGKSTQYPLSEATGDNSHVPLVWRKWRDLEMDFTFWRMIWDVMLSIYKYIVVAIASNAADLATVLYPGKQKLLDPTSRWRVQVSHLLVEVTSLPAKILSAAMKNRMLWFECFAKFR
jgi:hypothetical protein